MLERLESIVHVREILFLDPWPVHKIFPTVLAAPFRMFRQTFRFAETMKVIWAICRITTEFEWFKRFLLLLHGFPFR